MGMLLQPCLCDVCDPLPFLLFFFSEALLEDFLSQCSGAPTTAVELVKLSAAFCLPATPQLAQRVLLEFDLTEDQRSAGHIANRTRTQTDYWNYWNKYYQ